MNLEEQRDEKQAEIDRIAEKTHEIMERCDEVFGINNEQWDAYYHQIEENHKEMISLIHDLFIIKSTIKEQQAYRQGDPE